MGEKSYNSMAAHTGCSAAGDAGSKKGSDTGHVRDSRTERARGKTIIDSFTTYLLVEQGHSKLTSEAYMRDLKEFISYICLDEQDFDAASVTSADIRSWIASLARKGDSARTLRRKTQSLRSFFRYLHKRGIVKLNPAADIALAKPSKPLPKFVAENEMEKILEPGKEPESSFVEMRNDVIIEMLYATGMRRAELLALRDEDLDFNRGEIRIHGKRNKQRVVPLPQQLLSKLGAYLSMRDEKDMHDDGNHIFTTPHGAMSASTLQIIVRKALEHSPVAQRSPHVLRHSFATAMLNNGADLNTVKEFLGHSSLSTTQIYTHVSLAEMRDNYRKAHPRSPESSEK